MTRLLVDAAGWAGALGLLTAYALVSTGRVTGDGLVFQLLNLAGAVGLAVNGIYHGAWPSAGLNAVWLVIGLTALVRHSRARPATGPVPAPHTDRTEAGQPPGRTSTTTRPAPPPGLEQLSPVPTDPQETA